LEALPIGEVAAYYDGAVDTAFFMTRPRRHDRRTLLLTARRPGREPLEYPTAHFVIMISGGARELFQPYAPAEARALTIVLDDTLKLSFGPMQLVPRKRDPGPVADVQPRLATLLGSASLLALARADTAVAILGERRFPFSPQELADARALYVAARCAPVGAT
jgi:hypothetical protein